jgi:hypothetical protein
VLLLAQPVALVWVLQLPLGAVGAEALVYSQRQAVALLWASRQQEKPHWQMARSQ